MSLGNINEDSHMVMPGYGLACSPDGMNEGSSEGNEIKAQQSTPDFCSPFSLSFSLGSQEENRGFNQ